MNGSIGRRLAWIAMLATAHCVRHPPIVGEQPPVLNNSSAESAYQDALARYSDRSEIYDRLDTRLFAAATYQSWPFRQARVQRMALFQVQPPPVVLKKLDLEKTEFDAFHDFFLGVHVNARRFDDFDRPNSIWRVSLVTPTAEASPASIERIGRSDLNMRAIYPYMDEFWEGYRVRFPRKLPDGTTLVLPETAKLTLRVASTLGKAEMVFPVE
jgi:hypothetical protein